MTNFTHQLMRISLAVTVFMFCLASQAQMYKSVGPDGKISYSDTPPAGNQKVMETRDSAAAISSISLPYELAQAAKKNPVTIYAAPNCSPCQDGRSHLKSAGIPFAEKTVKTSEDLNKLQQISNDTQLPFLLVGNQKLRGYNQSEWAAALKNAGYPANNMLPSNYRYPAPESAAPAPAKPAEAAVDKSQPNRPAVSAPASENGFRF